MTDMAALASSAGWNEVWGTGVDYLRLRADGPGSAVSWRWELSGPTFIEDHEVAIDPSEWQYQAFSDLYAWFERNPGTDASQVVADVGDWITDRVFGRIGAALAGRAPCEVLVTLPAAATEASMPLELARIGGRTLAAQGVSLVIDLADVPREAGQTPAGKLRVLGLFSLPVGVETLNLRKERYELERLAAELSGLDRVIELRTLQYGTTRNMLTDAVEEGEGWHVVQLTGHGRTGRFVLERDDGQPDPVTGDELVGLLEPLRHTVRLVTLSSCRSGSDGSGSGGPEALATKLARQLQCAVIGMRYPVTASFAAAFNGTMYRLMFDKNVPLARARASAAVKAAAGPATAERSALSAGVTALYGASALGLRLTAPKLDGPVRVSDKDIKLAGFPEQPAYFVGQGPVMSRAAQAMAPLSASSGILLEGMAGTGKTALALELCYTQRRNFRVMVWHAVPPDPVIRTALASLCAALDEKLPGLGLTSTLDDDRTFRAFLPRLTELMKLRRILIVIDNAHPLLSSTGTWRDPRMRLLVDALTSHRDFGRVIISTRRPIAGITVPPVLTEHVEPLSEAEAFLLARELPRLRSMLDGDAPPLEPDQARGLAYHVLKLSCGYPGMLAQANDKAADPARLAAWALEAARAWPLNQA